MDTFSASVRVPGDRSSLAVSLLVENGRLTMFAHDHPIGDWSLDEIELHPDGAGYRMAAEGEELFIEVVGKAAFEEAVAQAQKPPGKPRRRKKATPAKHEKAPKPPERRKAAGAESVDQPEEGATNWFLAAVDWSIGRVERRLGPLLPAWVFTRATPVVLLAVIATAIVFPGVAANLFLLGGLVISALGAALFLDSHLAVRLLPGRSTPKHVLAVGLVVLTVGGVMAFAVG